jgi:hypothetical protein
MIKRAQQSTRPPTPATPNGAAGTTDTGFYYNAPELIQLAEDETLLASLPKTKHYSDRAVLAQTRLVRKLWRALLTEQYEDFAQHIAKADISLADDQARTRPSASSPAGASPAPWRPRRSRPSRSRWERSSRARARSSYQPRASRQTPGTQKTKTWRRGRGTTLRRSCAPSTRPRASSSPPSSPPSSALAMGQTRSPPTCARTSPSSPTGVRT